MLKWYWTAIQFPHNLFKLPLENQKLDPYLIFLLATEALHAPAQPYHVSATPAPAPLAAPLRGSEPHPLRAVQPPYEGEAAMRAYPRDPYRSHLGVELSSGSIDSSQYRAP
jgi:hypothetical protein